MNIHEAKCRNLKAIRKKLADVVGVDLHQRECQNPGNCKGTCPKCAAEEKKLNEALLKRGAIGAVAAAMSLGLTGCTTEDISRFAESMMIFSNSQKPEPVDIEIEEMGDVPMIEVEPDDYTDDTLIELSGEVAYDSDWETES